LEVYISQKGNTCPSQIQLRVLGHGIVPDFVVDIRPNSATYGKNLALGCVILQREKCGKQAIVFRKRGCAYDGFVDALSEKQASDSGLAINVD